MKRYLLFTGNQYYPSGGMEDFKGSFDTVDGAKTAIPDVGVCEGYEWGHIYDTEKMEILLEYYSIENLQWIKWEN